MPEELIKQFIDKYCVISLSNDSLVVTGIIKAVEGFWILIQEEDSSSRLVNGAMVRDIKAAPAVPDDIISPTDTTAIIEKIKELETQRPVKVETAKYIGMIWKNNLYREKYSSLEEFGSYELGWEKSKIYKYKDIGISFYDEKWNPLLPDLEEWGIRKLLILCPHSINTIHSLQKHGFINPSMSAKDLDEELKLWEQFHAQSPQE